jgi:Spy/CpxP family protein refolding chaperone
MNISKIIAWSGGLALALTTAVLPAQGFGPMMGGGPGQGGHCGPMGGALDLTEAQQTSFKAIRERHQASLEAKHKAAGEAREELRKAMQDPATSDARLKDLHTKAADTMLAVMLERRVMDREFEALLTPDQKAALAKQRQQGRPGMGRGKGHPGCGMEGGF